MLNVQKFALNASIPSKASAFRKSLNGVSRVYGKLADVFQAHLMVAFNNLNEHGNTTLLCICAEQAHATKGINASKVINYIADHVDNVKFKKKTNQHGTVSFTMFKDKSIEDALIEVRMPEVTWTEYSREPAKKVVKSEVEEIESLAKLLAGKKLSIEALDKAIAQAKVIRIDRDKKAVVKTKAEPKAEPMEAGDTPFSAVS